SSFENRRPIMAKRPKMTKTAAATSGIEKKGEPASSATLRGLAKTPCTHSAMGLSSHCTETSANRATSSKLASQAKNVRVIWIPSRRCGETPRPWSQICRLKADCATPIRAFSPTSARGNAQRELTLRHIRDHHTEPIVDVAAADNAPEAPLLGSRGA